MKIINKEYAEYKKALRERYNLEMQAVEGIKIKQEDYLEEIEAYRYKEMYHNYSGKLGVKIALNNTKLTRAGRKIGKKESQIKTDIIKIQREVVEKLFEEAEKIKLAER